MSPILKRGISAHKLKKPDRTAYAHHKRFMTQTKIRSGNPRLALGPGRDAVRFQSIDRVAQLGGALVEFFRDRGFHFALHDLESWTAAVWRATSFQPFVEEMRSRNFSRASSGKFDCWKNSRIASRPRSISPMASRKFALAQKDGRLGARVHHQHVGSKLLEAPGQFFALGVVGDEIEKIEIALRVANDAGEIVDLKQAQDSDDNTGCLPAEARCIVRR